jgi:Na+/H+ antiporter NhaD/arsenite permease-like protein
MTWLVLAVFVLGYCAIAFEQWVRINKAAVALVTGILCWTLYTLGASDTVAAAGSLVAHVAEIAGILFFLLGAMVIVELMDAHDSFDLISERIRVTDRRRLLWIVGGITFFLSPVLDNLTTTIVMVSLLRKLIQDTEQRMPFVAVIVIAANAGGAWSPIGDVTTTMLWIGGQITATNIVVSLFVPSAVCLAVPLLLLSLQQQGQITVATEPHGLAVATAGKERQVVFFLGLGALLFVPVFKALTDLPPFMGMLLGLGALWIVTELMHSRKDDEERGRYSVARAIQRIDTPSILFFLGILVAVAALQSQGILAGVAAWLERVVGNMTSTGVLIGFLSAIIDNVPLVAAAQAMYPLAQFPADHYLWELLAYCTGNGGSLLIIGSAAGIAAMGMERINFFWYLRRITLVALVGYLAGVAIYVLQSSLMR